MMTPPTREDIYKEGYALLDLYDRKYLYNAWHRARKVKAGGCDRTRTVLGDKRLLAILSNDHGRQFSLEMVRNWRIERHPGWTSAEDKQGEITTADATVETIVRIALGYCEHVLEMDLRDGIYASQLATYTCSLIGYSVGEIARETGTDPLGVYKLIETFPHHDKECLAHARTVMERSVKACSNGAMEAQEERKTETKGGTT